MPEYFKCSKFSVFAAYCNCPSFAMFDTFSLNSHHLTRLYFSSEVFSRFEMIPPASLHASVRHRPYFHFFNIHIYDFPYSYETPQCSDLSTLASLSWSSVVFSNCIGCSVQFCLLKCSAGKFLSTLLDKCFGVVTATAGRSSVESLATHLPKTSRSRAHPEGPTPNPRTATPWGQQLIKKLGNIYDLSKVVISSGLFSQI